jgi:hypothetical protein
MDIVLKVCSTPAPVRPSRLDFAVAMEESREACGRQRHRQFPVLAEYGGAYA